MGRCKKEDWSRVKIHLGCGDVIKEGYVNVDLYSSTADLKWDLNVFPYPFADNSADEILIIHTLEHCKEPMKVVDEMIRICKPGGKIIVEVPHYNHANAVEAAHTTFFNDSWFNYWYEPKKSYHAYYPRNGLLKLLKIKQKPTILGRLVPIPSLRMLITKTLNIPLIFSLIFELEVVK